MKCTYCGADVDAQAVKCPFCGQENAQGVAFKKQVEEKKKRNKDLPRFVLRLQEKEIKGKLLTRMNVGLILVNVLLVVLSFVIFIINEEKPKRQVQPGSQAEQFIQEFYYDQEYGSGMYNVASLYENMVAFIEKFETGEEIKEYRIRYLADYSFRAMKDASTKQTEEQKNKTENLVRTFFMGYLGFAEEDMSFVKYDQADDWPYSLPRDTEEKVMDLMQRKMRGMKE